MPFVEDGVKYPREIDPPFGLPPGWKSIERAYGPKAKCAGQTYIRFDSPDGKHKTVGSIKAAITKDAEDRGVDPIQAVSAWEQAVSAEKEAKQKEREENGFLEGQKLEDAIECFRAKYGALNGATVCNLPGWRGESKILENCGQNSAMYYSPKGVKYPLLKNIEAHFGLRMLSGLEVPDIEAARQSVKVDENGKVINVARKENIKEIFTHQVDAEVKKHKRRRRHKQFLEENDVVDGDFAAQDLLSIVQLRTPTTSQELQESGVTNVSQLTSEVSSIHEVLVERGFAENIQLMYVTGGSKNHTSDTSALLDHLSAVYYQRPGEFNEHPCYQQIILSQTSRIGVECGYLHLFWSATKSCWKLGKLDESLAGFARCFETKPIPVGLASKWELYTK